MRRDLSTGLWLPEPARFVPGCAPCVVSRRSFPTILGVNNNPNRTTSRTGSTSVVLPTGSTSGDRTIICFAAENSANITTPGGWADIGVQASFGAHRYKAFYADSVGAGPVSVTHGSARTSCVSIRLGNCHASAPETTTSVTATNTNPNPPSVTSSWGAANTLALAIGSFGVGTVSGQSFTAPPSGYTTGVSEGGASGNSGIVMCIASLQTLLATEDPGTFTISASNVWLADTILIRAA